MTFRDGMRNGLIHGGTASRHRSNLPAIKISRCTATKRTLKAKITMTVSSWTKSRVVQGFFQKQVSRLNWDEKRASLGAIVTVKPACQVWHTLRTLPKDDAIKPRLQAFTAISMTGFLYAMPCLRSLTKENMSWSEGRQREEIIVVGPLSWPHAEAHPSRRSLIRLSSMRGTSAWRNSLIKTT